MELESSDKIVMIKNDIEPFKKAIQFFKNQLFKESKS